MLIENIAPTPKRFVRIMKTDKHSSSIYHFPTKKIRAGVLYVVAENMKQKDIYVKEAVSSAAHKYPYYLGGES